MDQERKWILFGAGGQGRRLLHKFGREKVYAFCDNNLAGERIEEKKVIDVETLCEIYRSGKYRVMISVLFPITACEIARQLQVREIDFELCGECIEKCWPIYVHITESSFHLYCGDDDFWAVTRLKRWRLLFEQMLDRYKSELSGLKLDFWLYLGDWPEHAYLLLKCGKIPAHHILAFNTRKELEDIVISVPDFMYGKVNNGGISDKTYERCIAEYITWDECVEICKEHAELPWENEKAFWIGNLNNHFSRQNLYSMGKKFSDKLEIKSYDWNTREGFLPMTEWYRYKYLIDARGHAWTDKIKVLYWLGRPVFINERPYTEFWMKYGWEDGKHYISVKEDFSDLIEKLDELATDPKRYEKMREDMHCFAEKYLTKEFALAYLKEMVLKYGVKK